MSNPLPTETASLPKRLESLARKRDPKRHERTIEWEAGAEIAKLRGLVATLRAELSSRAFHPGEWPGYDHIRYCDFCNYSEGYIAKHGHGGCCLLKPEVRS